VRRGVVVIDAQDDPHPHVTVGVLGTGQAVGHVVVAEQTVSRDQRVSIVGYVNRENEIETDRGGQGRGR
jgi:hypothetical protein